MALSITPASVLPGSDAVVEHCTAGATITAGQALYLDSTTNTVKLADANGAAALRSVYGIALNGGASGQPITVQKSGAITIGGTVVSGTVYVLGATAAGDIEAASALTTGWYTSIIGVATSASVIQLHIFNSGAVT